MEISTYSQCACAECGYVIEFRTSRAGEIVECPNCHGKSRLPEPEKLAIIEVQGPPIPLTQPCKVCGKEMPFLAKSCPSCEFERKRKFQFAMLVVSALVVVVLGVFLLVRQFRKPELAAEPAGSISNAPAPQGHIMMEQPHPLMPKSINDLKVGKFGLEQRRGSDLVLAVGDIENDSENVHTGLQADLDLLDKSGAKIGTVSDFSSELGPHQTWHFLATVTKTNAFSVRFARIMEN